jgi:hypothetical protein
VNAVVKGRRKLTIGQAIGIERVLGLDEGFLMMLQTMHEIELFKNNMRKSSGLPPNIRRILFWDLDFDTLDWLRYRTFVIKRVEERGSDAEIAEIHRYYSQINS